MILISRYDGHLCFIIGLVLSQLLNFVNCKIMLVNFPNNGRSRTQNCNSTVIQVAFHEKELIANWLVRAGLSSFNNLEGLVSVFPLW